MPKGGARPGAGRPKGVANKATLARAAEIAATGETPLEYMLRVMRDPGVDHGRRDEMAKAASPYVHARLAAVEHTGRVEHNYVARLPAPVADMTEWQKRYTPPTVQ